MSKQDTITIYAADTGAPMHIPAAHLSNYLGKGWVKTKPKTTKKKES